MERCLLVATDGSPAAVNAVHVGLGLASAQRANVVFLHATRALRKFLAQHPAEEPTQEQVEELDPVLRAAAAAAREKGVSAELVAADEHRAERIASQESSPASPTGKARR